MNPRLAAIAGGLKGKVVSLNKPSVVIGRERTADISLRDIAVSRRHSQVERQGDQFCLSDLKSLNGTFVNGVPINQRALQHGDRIRQLKERASIFRSRRTGESWSRSDAPKG